MQAAVVAFLAVTFLGPKTALRPALGTLQAGSPELCYCCLQESSAALPGARTLSASQSSCHLPAHRHIAQMAHLNTSLRPLPGGSSRTGTLQSRPVAARRSWPQSSPSLSGKCRLHRPDSRQALQRGLLRSPSLRLQRGLHRQHSNRGTTGCRSGSAATGSGIARRSTGMTAQLPWWPSGIRPTPCGWRPRLQRACTGR